MKGFHKHGVCTEASWPNFGKRGKPGTALDGWDANAPQTPLGAYYRIDGKSIVDMQSAIFETHAIYVSADVHDGWNRVKNNRKSLEDALIEPPKDPDDVGGHAFAIVGYTSDGFIVQNSWGPEWGFHGFACCPTKTGPVTARMPGRWRLGPRCGCRSRRSRERPRPRRKTN